MMKKATISTETMEDPRGFDAELEEIAKTYTPKYRPWTEKEDEMLRRYYGRVPLTMLVKKLDRTKNSITGYAAKIGIAGSKGE